MSQAERVFEILYQLSREDGHISLRDISERFGVSRRQACRDIEYVRNFVMPISTAVVYDSSTRSYRISEESGVLSRWREDMIVSFAVLSSMTAGTIGKDEISSAIPMSMKEILSHIDYKSPVASSEDEEKWLSPIFESFYRHKALVIRYRKDPGQKSKDRLVDPLKLVNYQGIWYLLAYDRAPQDVRTFRLSRFDKAFVSDEDSAEHSEEDVDRILGSSYGIFLGKSKEDAEAYTMRFSGRAATLVSAEIWHPEQKGRWVGEEYELSLKAASPVELISRLLSYGPEATPVSPPHFVEMYNDKVRQMYEKQYGNH